MYQQVTHPISGDIMDIVLRTEDGAYIPADEDNLDRQEFDAWVAQGNQPQPPEAA